MKSTLKLIRRFLLVLIFSLVLLLLLNLILFFARRQMEAISCPKKGTVCWTAAAPGQYYSTTTAEPLNGTVRTFQMKSPGNIPFLISPGRSAVISKIILPPPADMGKIFLF